MTGMMRSAFRYCLDAMVDQTKAASFGLKRHFFVFFKSRCPKQNMFKLFNDKRKCQKKQFTCPKNQNLNNSRWPPKKKHIFPEVACLPLIIEPQGV